MRFVYYIAIILIIGFSSLTFFSHCSSESASLLSKPLRIWTESTTGMEFVWIEPGCFQMGQSADERAQLIKEYGEKYVKRMFDNEPNQLEICISNGFWMSRTEVTQNAWHRIMGDNRVFYFQNDLYPAHFLTWNDANAFAQKLGERYKDNGLIFRLPTESEWEHAARAGSASPYYTGATLTSEQANFCGLFPFNGGKRGVYLEKLMPVGSYPPNKLGLYDMYGNVEEWCDDEYVEPKPNSNSVREPFSRVAKGGRYSDHGMHVRSAARRGYTQFYVSSEVGFRLVRGQ
jgi:formylglycine-generating enzyme required for sulfatase activity